MVEFKPIEGVPYKFDYLYEFSKLRGQSDDVKLRKYRWLCRNDLFFLLYFGLGWEFIQQDFRWADWWVRRIREVEDGPRSKTLDLWFRESGKSAIMTVGENIQDILRDPDITICILAYARHLSKDFLKLIKTSLEDDTMLKVWFPDILYANPRKDSPQWSVNEGIIVRREHPRKEATVEAWGLIDGMPTGRHYKKRSYDDVVTKESVLTPGQLSKTLEAYQLSKNLGMKGGRERIAGTRYDFGDLYGFLIDQVDEGLIDLHVRQYPIRYDFHGKYAYNVFTEEEVHEKEMEQGPFVFAAQNLLTPIHPEDQAFNPEHLRFWTKLPGTLDNWPKYLLGDLAGWEEKGKSIKGDRSAFLVVGVDENDAWWILECKMGRFSPTEIMDHLFASHDRWKWGSFSLEEEKLEKVLSHFLKAEQERRGHYLMSKPVKHGQRSKDLRIQGLQPRYEAGKIVVHPEMRDLMDEFRQFPHGRFRDGLDALAYGNDVITGRAGKKMKRKRRRPTAINTRGGW